MSIGYNYDGKHDFIPYQVIEENPKNTYSTSDFDDYGNAAHVSNNIFDLVEIKYLDVFDNPVPVKDHIFEISKLIKKSDIAELMPELFYEVYERQYANAWNDFSLIKVGAIVEQIAMTVAAGGASAALIAGVAASWAPYAAPFVFAAVYFLLSWTNSEEKARIQKGINDAMTYYPSGDFSEPTSLSEKTAKDRLFDDSLAAYNQGHPGAYYTTVIGGEPGDMYTGELMVTPPHSGGNIKSLIDAYDAYINTYESFINGEVVYVHDSFGGPPLMYTVDQEDVDRAYNAFLASTKNSVNRNNLDYLILSSELPALNGKEFYSFDSGLSTSGDALINYYRYNTLGYLESEIKSVSRGEYDAIRPMVINGIPQYRYIDTRDEIIDLTQPLSPLYGPIVVSQEAYDNLEIEDAKISVKAQVAYLDNTEGVDANKLELSELTRYKAKINISEINFAYDISFVTIDVLEIIFVKEYDAPTPTIFQTGPQIPKWHWKKTYEVLDSFSIELSPDQYKLEGNTLYFYKSFEELVFGNQEDFDSVWSGENGLTFSVNVHFPIIIPDTKTETNVLDTTSNDLARTALAQTTQHAINDYFNLYTVAATNAMSQAELEFTIEVTFWSTLISSAILLPISIYAQASRAAMLVKEIALPTVVLKQLAALSISPIAEIIEEVYVDSFIEAWIEGQVAIHGGDERLARFVSMLVTSLREASNTGLDLVVGMFGTDSDSDSNTNLDTLKSDLEQDVKLSWKSLISTDTVVGLTLAALSFASGNIAFGMGFLGGTFTDTLGVPVEEYARIQTAKQVLLKVDQEVKLDSILEQASLQQIFKPITIPLLIGASVAKLPTLSRFEALSAVSTAMNEFYKETSQNILQTSEAKFKQTERNQYGINTIEETSQSSFDSLTDKPASQLVTRLGQLGYIIDPVWGREGEVLQFNLVHLAKGGMKIGSAIRMAAEALGMDRSKVKVLIIKGQVITPYGMYIDKNGIVKQIGKGLTFDELLTDIGYEYDINDPDSWLGDIDQQIQVLYVDELNADQRSQIGGSDLVSISPWLFPSVLATEFDSLMHELIPRVRAEIFYRNGITHSQRISFSEKLMDIFSIVKSRVQDTFRVKTIHESVYNILKTKYSEDFGITQDEWLELVDSKAKDEHGAFTQEFEKIVDLCLKEQVFLNLIELSGAQDQDVNAIFNTLDAYLDDNIGSLIEQLFAPLTFEAFISEAINQVLNNMDNEGFVSFNIQTHEYFEDLISVQDSYKDELVSVELPLINYEFFNDRWNRDKIETLFYTIEHIKYLINSPREFEKGIFIRPVFSQLQGPSGAEYGMEYNKILLRKFMKFTDFELTQASWVRINEYNQEVLKNRLNFKDFCRLYLNKFQQDPELSNKYHWLAGFEFSEESFDFDDTDFILLQLFDDAMIDFLGFNNYLLLQSSILNFGKENNNYFSDCALHDSSLLEHAKEEFGLKTLDESEFEIYPTDGDYWKSVFKSWFSFGFKREMTINGKPRSYIKHPPNSIFSEIFSGYNAWSIDSDYFKMINQITIGTLVREGLIPVGFQEDSTFEAMIENNDLRKSVLANFLDQKTGELKYNLDKVKKEGDLLNVYKVVEKDGTVIEDREKQNLLKGVLAEKTQDIFKVLEEIYNVEINEQNDLISKKEEIIEKIKEKYQLEDNDNVAFALKTFTMNNKPYSIFLISIKGQQFMAGTYLYYDNNKQLQIGYNPFAPINMKYPAIWRGLYYALGHSERKIYITLDTLFPSSNIENGEMIIVSEKPFCFSCEIMGINFYEYYNKEGVFITIVEGPNKHFFIFN